MVQTATYTLCLQVCNHPDLFEGRPIVSSFDMFGFPFHLPSAAMHALAPPLWQDIGIASIGADLLAQEENTCWAAQETQVSKLAHCLQTCPLCHWFAAMPLHLPSGQKETVFDLQLKRLHFKSKA